MSNATLREALEAARQFIANGIEYGYIRMPDSDTPDSAHDTLPMIDAALAADDAARGTMPEAASLVAEQAEDEGLWFVAQTAPEAYLQQELRKLHAAVEASRAAAPQADPTDPGRDVEVLREHVRHLERRVRQLAAAPQSVEPVWYRWRFNGEWHSGQRPLFKEGYTHTEALYLAPPTAPTDAEWQEEAMRLAEDYAGAHCVQWGEPDEAEVANAKQALRAHIATRPAAELGRKS